MAQAGLTVLLLAAFAGWVVWTAHAAYTRARNDNKNPIEEFMTLMLAQVMVAIMILAAWAVAGGLLRRFGGGQ